MDEINQNKEIDDFLMDQLSPSEKEKFVAKMEKDRSLQEAVELRRVLLEQVDTIGQLRLKDKILNIKKEVEIEDRQIGRRRIIRLAVVAAATITMLFFGLRFFNATPNNQVLFAENYSAYDLKFGERKEGADPTLLEAGNLYQEKKFREALTIFRSLNLQSGDDRTFLAEAICLLELKQYDEAISTLQALSTRVNFLYKDQAQWYLGLTYLQVDQVNESKKMLKLVAENSRAYFKEEASRLLSKLN